MESTTRRISGRISEGIKRLQPVIRDAKADDAGESDTKKVVAFCLFEIFGHRSTPEAASHNGGSEAFIDLSINTLGLPFLLETRAIGLNLNDEHLNQAVSRAHKKSLDWVVITNGQTWKVYKVIISAPIDQVLIAEIDLLAINPENVDEAKGLFMLCREFWQKPLDIEIISDDTVPF
jgi:hypothetical protein